MTSRIDAATLQQYKILEVQFDRAARLYDATYGPADGDGSHGNPLLDWLRTEHLSVLRDLLPPGATVLDIGCGTGEEALALAREGYGVLGIDVSPAMVRLAQAKAAVHGVGRQFTRTHWRRASGRLDERGPFQGRIPAWGRSTPRRICRRSRSNYDCWNRRAVRGNRYEPRCLYEWARAVRRLRPAMMDRRRKWAEGRWSRVIAPVRSIPARFAAFFRPFHSGERARLPAVAAAGAPARTLPGLAGSFRPRQAVDADASVPGFRAWGRSLPDGAAALPSANRTAEYSGDEDADVTG